MQLVALYAQHLDAALALGPQRRAVEGVGDAERGVGRVCPTVEAEGPLAAWL